MRMITFFCPHHAAARLRPPGRGKLLVQSLDFFRAFWDDPFVFGQVRGEADTWWWWWFCPLLGLSFCCPLHPPFNPLCQARVHALATHSPRNSECRSLLTEPPYGAGPLTLTPPCFYQEHHHTTLFASHAQAMQGFLSALCFLSHAGSQL